MIKQIKGYRLISKSQIVIHTVIQTISNDHLMIIKWSNKSVWCAMNVVEQISEKQNEKIKRYYDPGTRMLDSLCYAIDKNHYLVDCVRPILVVILLVAIVSGH